MAQSTTQRCPQCGSRDVAVNDVVGAYIDCNACGIATAIDPRPRHDAEGNYMAQSTTDAGAR